MSIRYATLALCLLLPLAAQAGDPSPAGINAEIRQEMREAREEVRAELAEARRELATENLRIDNSLRFSRHDGEGAGELPRAEITPQGDFLIEGEAQEIDAQQRRQLLAYRGQVLQIAATGIDIGQRTAEATLEEIGESSWVGLLFSAMSGRMERRIERLVRQQVEPAVLEICNELPAVRVTQQQLASSVPQFRPYATIGPNEADDCAQAVRQEFASL